MKLLFPFFLKDPLLNFENHLLAEGIINEAEVTRLKTEIKKEINDGLEVAYAEEMPIANSEFEVKSMYKDFDFSETTPASNLKSDKRYIDARHTHFQRTEHAHKQRNTPNHTRL